MLEAYRVYEKDQILFVGEGNFSFSKSFISWIETYDPHILKEIEVVSTCKESNSETFSDFKENTIKFLLAKGVNIVFNVDATNLKCHPEIGKKKFNKIIFNFPHIGGKMKIHLNRKLLKDFFFSARGVLAEGGWVVVALCDGQGGTAADGKQRHWHDTWQVTEMAAQSDFVLHRVETFDPATFPHYVNVGYRSCDKSFYSKNSVVHVFKTQVLPRIILEDPCEWFKVEDMKEDMIFEFLDSHMRNPFSNPQSPSNYVYNTLLEKLGPNFNTHNTVVNYCYDQTNVRSSVDNVINIFTKLKEEKVDVNRNIFRLVMKTKPVILKDFSKAPVSCIMIILGLDSTTSVINEYLSHMVTVFRTEGLVNVVTIGDEVWKSKILVTPETPGTFQAFSAVEVFVLPNGTPCHMVHVDLLAQFLFKLIDWRSLWDGEVEISSDGQAIFCPISLFPKGYAFDLGLSVPLHLKDQFENRFLMILWLLAGDMIVKTEHLTTYFPTDRELVCYCYRITYTSQKFPLHRKRIIHIHENIIAKFISKSLQINIT